MKKKSFKVDTIVPQILDRQFCVQIFGSADRNVESTNYGNFGWLNYVKSHPHPPNKNDKLFKIGF